MDIANQSIRYITPINNTTVSSSFILPVEKMKNKLNEISNQLGHPVTIININCAPEEYQQARVDSDVSYFAIRPTCRNLRMMVGNRCCFICDNYHAQMLKARLLGKDFDLDIPDFFSESRKPVSPELKLRTVRGVECSYLQYSCPLLGYIELCYPVRFYGKMIGVMMVGQILEKEHLAEKQRIAEEFVQQNKLEDEKGIFHAYLEQWKKVCPESKPPLDRILLDRELFEAVPNLCKRDGLNQNYSLSSVLNADELDKLIERCCDEVKKLEDYLIWKWKEKIKKNTEYVIDDIKESFRRKYRNIRNEKELTYQSMQKVYDAIYESFIKLKNEFSFHYCRLFINNPEFSVSAPKTVTARMGDCPYDLNCNFQAINLSMTVSRNSLEDVLDNPLKCFSGKKEARIDPNCNVALACENLAVLFGVESFDPVDDNPVHEYIKIVFWQISKLFMVISADLERIFSLFLQKQHENTLHLYRHECAHLADRIQQNNKYYRNRERYNMLTESKQENIYRDILSAALTLKHLSTNIGLLIDSSSVKDISQMPSRDIDIRDEFNKWRAMFRLELSKRKLRLLYDTPPMYSTTRFHTYGDLFIILLYNLIDNAVKYSFWGTNIHVEVSPRQIMVKDYGIKIENSEKPYMMYYRERDHVQNRLGDGIGLYTARKAAKILGLSLKHTCEKVSDYHIPFVYEAAKRELDLELNGKSVSQIQTVLNKTLRSRRYDLLTDDTFYKPDMYFLSEEELRAEILNATYCVTFTITL